MFRSLGFVLLTTLLSLGPVVLAQQEVDELPDGPGKERVEGACLICHGADLITTSTGYTHEQWEYVISKMMRLPEPAASEITQYLATNFPESYDRRPTLVAGDTKITFQEWNVPTLGQRPRDPLQTPDGTIWWAGMYGSLIGRLDPKTGRVQEYALDPTARPHSIINDPAGNIWYTGNSNATLGMLDPKTGEIKEWPSPSGPKSHPYAIEVIDDIIWYNESNQRPDALVRFDPKTEKFQSWAIPSGSSGT